jgi:undecaprenyl-diphosphatase
MEIAMSILQAILLGALQGVTEFLPVSSSGHLVIAREFLSIDEVPILFDILLHVATLAAVVVVFRRRIVAILAALVRIGRDDPDGEDRTNRRLFLWLLAATVITGVLGILFSKLEIETMPRIVSILFIVTGIILVVTKNRQGDIDYRRVGWKQSVVTGIAQGVGVFPGISRSGITISAALMSGMKREQAGEFSFLLAIPAILGALLLKIGDAGELMNVVSPLGLLSGVGASFIVGLAALLILLRLVRQGRLYLFAFYLVPLGIVTFILV